MILIVGAGGHGAVVADILRAAGSRPEQLAFLDDDVARHTRTLAGSVVLGPLSLIDAVRHDEIIVAIGENATRSQVFARLAAAGERFAVAIHPRAVLAQDVLVGDGSMIAAGVIVNTGSSIGRNAIVNTGATVDHHTTVGDDVHIAPGVHMGGGVSVGKGALVGIGAVVLPRVSIGAGSRVGAGAVVVTDVPPGVTVVGVPARVTGATATV